MEYQDIKTGSVFFLVKNYSVCKVEAISRETWIDFWRCKRLDFASGLPFLVSHFDKPHTNKYAALEELQELLMGDLRSVNNELKYIEIYPEANEVLNA
jgi:hypothetical protein